VAGLAGTTGVREPVPCQTSGVVDMSKDANDSNSDDEESSQLPKGLRNSGWNHHAPELITLEKIDKNCQ